MGAHKEAKTEYLRAAITTTQHEYTPMAAAHLFEGHA